LFLGDWPAVSIEMLRSGLVRGAILFRIATGLNDSPIGPVIRLWAGIGEMTIDADTIEDDAGNLYQGLGLLGGIPAVSELINGLQERIAFSISGEGMTADIAAIASTEAADIRGARCNLGFLIFDKDWQIASPTAWLWEGTADSLTISRDGDAESATRTITLSVGSLFTGRRRPQIAYFTDADQKRRSPDDDFFINVRGYSAKTTKVWPI
jgi:hypothetical protein